MWGKRGKCYVCSLYAPIRRGQPVWPYMVTADERLQELDYDKLVFEMDSPWQNIRIFHSKENGNVLFLDGDASEWNIPINQGCHMAPWKV